MRCCLPVDDRATTQGVSDTDQPIEAGCPGNNPPNPRPELLSSNSYALISKESVLAEPSYNCIYYTNPRLLAATCAGGILKHITRIFQSHWGDDVPLYRYMDLYGLLSLLTEEKLKFTNLSEFEDGFEGRPPLRNTETFHADFRAGEYFSRPVDEVQKLRHRLEHSRYKTWVTSWQQSERESSLMWRVYASEQNGVAIRTNANKLLSALDSRYKYTAGPVQYIDYLKEAIAEEEYVAFSFHKQNGYRSECEFRVAIFEPATNTGLHPYLVETDLASLIESIVVSPWANEWQVNALKSAIRALDYNPALVKRSGIMGIDSSS